MSHRGDLTERLVRIPLLLAERPRSQQELAQEFNVDGITIRRNLNELSRFYYITDERRGRQVFYRFGDGYQYRPPNFMPAELAMLLLAQQSIAATGLASFGTPFAGYGRALLAKVRSTLPKGLRDYLDALASVFGTAAVPAKDYHVVESSSSAEQAADRSALLMTAAASPSEVLSRGAFMDTLFQDLKFGFRTMARNPGFVTVAVVTLALGIGANTAIFSVVNAALLTPLPFRDPVQLVLVKEVLPKIGPQPVSVSAPDILEIQKWNRSLEAVAALRVWSFELSGQGEPQRAGGNRVVAL